MEEELIYELVDGISDTQEKINQLTSELENPTNTDEISLKQNKLQQKLNQNYTKIANYQKELQNNEIKFSKNNSNTALKQKEIENSLDLINQKLKSYYNDNKQIYKTSYEKMEKIILNKKSEDSLRELMLNYNSLNNSYQSLLEVIQTNETKKNQINDLIFMLEEDKNNSENKIIEYISEKESYEEIAKLYLKKFIKKFLIGSDKNNKTMTNIKNISQSYRKFGNKILDLNLYFYEINNIDINKLSNEISNMVINMINMLVSNNSLKNNIKINNNPNDISNYNSPNNLNHSKLMNNTATDFNKYMNKTYNNFYHNSQNGNDNNKSLVSVLVSKLQKEIIYFITSNLTNNNNNNSSQVENLFDKLKDIIISFINLYYSAYFDITENENVKHISYLKYFLKNIFKSFYFEFVVSNESVFLNKQYKISKKNYLIKFNEINVTLNKLYNKKDEFILKLTQIEEKIKFCKSSLNNCDGLSQGEKTYLELNERRNELIENKNKIEYDLIENENQYKYNIDNIKKNIMQIKKQNENIKKSLLECEKEKDIKNKNTQIEINNLKSSIKDKYLMIKAQIELYKKKHGGINMDLYNKFTDKINESLGVIKTENISNDTLLQNSSIFNVTDNNIFRNEKIESYKSLKQNDKPKRFIKNIFNSYNSYNMTENKKNNNNRFAKSSKKIKVNIPLSPPNTNNNKILSIYGNKNTDAKVIPNPNSYYVGKPTNNIKQNQSYDINHKNKPSNYFINISNLNSSKKNSKLSSEPKNGKINNNYEITQKINSLFVEYTCLFRKNKIDDTKFDPMYHSSILDNNILGNDLFGFIPVKIKLEYDDDKNLILLLTNIKNSNDQLFISCSDIQTTKVNNNIKYFIKVYQKYKNFYSNNLEEFLNSEEVLNIPLDKDRKIFATKNKYYNFSLVVVDRNNCEKRYEFIFEGYENVKKWINGLNLIARNKNIIMSKNNKNNIDQYYSNNFYNNDKFKLHSSGFLFQNY